MKTGIIIVLYHTPQTEIDRLTDEIKQMGFDDYKIYFVDNSHNGHGFAEGVNVGLRKAQADHCRVFVVCNPDISFGQITSKDIHKGLQQFDILGFAMKQGGRTYFGGKIDKWRMSGGLKNTCQKVRYVSCDFVTGSLMILTKKVLDTVGLFDESYFMYYEDVDFCHRARKKNLTVGVDTEKRYEHFEVSQHNPHKNYMLAKNRFVFLMRYGSLLQKFREVLRSPRTLWEERKIVFNMFWNSQFVRNFFSLNISSLINKLLHFALFVTMVRFIPIKEYGIYTLVWTHVNIFSPLTDFGTISYGMVYLPREKKDRIYSLFTLRALFSVFVFSLTVAASIFFRYSPQIVFFIFIISSVIFYNMASGMYLILSSVSGNVVKASFISILINAVMIAGLIATSFTFKSIFTIFVTASLFYLMYTVCYLLLIKHASGTLTLVFDLPEWKQIIKKSYIFVLINLFAGLYFRIDVLILNAIKGPVSVGVYSSGYKFLDALTLFASSYNTIATPSLSKIAYENKKLLPGRLIKHVLFLTLIGFSAVAATLLFGNIFLPFILKGNYLQAIPVVEILIWALPLILYNSIFLNLLYASELSHLVVLLFMMAAVINAVLNMIFIPFFSYTASSYITVVSECINLFILLILVFGIYRKKIFHE